MSSKNPLQFASQITASFVESAIDRFCAQKNPQILDVGCGDSKVALELVARGLCVTGIDPKLEAVNRSSNAGFAAIHCTLEDFSIAEPQLFDCIYLSRTLHHLPSLAESVANLDKLLTRRGIVVIDDFGFEFADGAACKWLFDQANENRRIESESEEYKYGHEWLKAHPSDETEALFLWKHRYEVEHHLWSFQNMSGALRDQFEVVSESRVAYLFRFICDLLPSTVQGAQQAARIWEEENDLAKQARMSHVGFRMVLRKS